MEVLGVTENRYSGIPTMRRELERAGMRPPEFRQKHGTFVVCFRKTRAASEPQQAGPDTQGSNTTEDDLLRFCTVTRSRQEIAKFLNIKSVLYAARAHVMPLAEQGLLIMSLPEKLKSPKQRYKAKRTE